jgi:hypothetical protein
MGRRLRNKIRTVACGNAAETYKEPHGLRGTKLRCLKHGSVHAAVAVAVLLLFSLVLRAQSDGILDVSGAGDPKSQTAGRPAPPFWPQTAGQADIAFQGYYLSGSGQPLINASGAALNIQEFLPGIGVLHAAVEGSGGNGFHTGTMFVGIEQAPIFGWHWDFLGGDSQISSDLMSNSITNIYTPDISTRGVSVAMKRKDRSYQVYYGDDTLLGGPRIPYRLTLPQKIFGATMKQDVGERWKFGVRYLHLDTNASVLTTQTNFFFPGHAFQTSDSLAFQSSYSLSKDLKLFGEMNYTKATPFASSPATQEPVSFFAGSSWETDRFSLRANYVLQSVSYLPLLGYFSGDRRGPFVEGRYRVTPNIELYGSGSAYSNNLEHNSLLPTFHSSGFSGGGSFILPWKLNASASISTLQLATMNPQQAASASSNRQINLDVNRGFGRHNLRFSHIDLNLDSNVLRQSERFTEGEDTFTWKHLVLRGAVRFQGSQSTATRNTLFFRGAIQANLRRFSAYANFEKGNDLVNRSVFSTNAYSSTVIGFSAPLFGGWNLQAEAFRNNLNTTLTPQNVFLFPTADLGATQLPGFSQWSGYFRIGKQFRWGNKEFASSSGIDQYAAARVPLVGSVQGLVMEKSLAGTRPAANVGVSLDLYRSAVTDASGHYTFSDVPEGSHVVGLDMDQLPIEYEPGPQATARVTMEPRALVRSDFSVVRLTRLVGKITAPPDRRVDSVVIRLAGTNRYTTPDEDGQFSFYNLREGPYMITIDLQTIPDDTLLSTPASLQVSTSDENESPAAIEFRLEPKPQVEKPIRQILQQQIHVGSSVQPAVNPAPANGTKKSKKGGSGDKYKRGPTGD